MSRKTTLALGIVTIAALAVVGLTRRGESQAGGGKLVLGVYAPTVEFGSSTAAYQYVQGLAKAVEQRTGQKVDPKVVSSHNALKSADIGIMDAQCYAVARRRYNLLANGEVGGGSGRRWALYSSVGPSMQGLRGKKLAYVRTGCNDKGFIENAMFESEVGLSYFGGRVGKSNLSGAVAAVAAYKNAQAVFAPVGSQKGLAKVFDAATVPGPAFVQINGNLSGSLVGKVKSAVINYGGGGAIGGWSSPNDGAYRGLAGRMQRRVKRGIFASPNVVRLGGDDVVVIPETIDEVALPEVKQHFRAPPERLE